MHLTSDDEAELKTLARLSRGQRHAAFRARVILACATGKSNAEVGRQLRAAPHTVGKWRKRYLAKGIDGLLDEPRPGKPRQIGDAKIAEVVSKTLESTPEGATHWSTRLMAEKIGLSHSTVGRVWRAFGLKPHRTETFNLSNDPLLVEKVRDIVGLYMDPPANALVLCVDEKSQIQALDRTQPINPMLPGRTERRTPDYQRHGTTSLFAALDVATGNVIGTCYERHRATEFLAFLQIIEQRVPDGLQIHLVMDNYATHKTPAIKSWLAKRPHFQVHFTPTHGSWINQVERWFGLLTQRQIKRGSHTSVAQLEQAIEEFIHVTNASPKPFKWVATADQILARISRFAQRTLQAHTETDL